MLDLKQNWNYVLSLLSEDLNEVSFDAWIFPLKATSYDEARKLLYLEADNSLMIDTINSRYLTIINKYVNYVFNDDIKIDLSLNDGKAKALKEKEVDASLTSTTSTATAEFSKEYIFNPKYSFENFVVGSNNSFARAACLAVAENPAHQYNPLFLYGDPGLGKTHLMHAIGHFILKNNSSKKVLYISSEMFTSEIIQGIQNNRMAEFKNKYRNVDVLLIDDIQFLQNKEKTQDEFFWTFNTLYDNNKQIVISSDKPPKELVNLEERLRQRFLWNLVVDIKPPDFETRIAILYKKLEQEGVEINSDIDQVIYLIAEKIKYNIRELEGALVRIVSFSKLMKKDINIKFAREILEDIIPQEDFTVSLEVIKKEVSTYFGISVEDMESINKARKVAHPRQIAMYLCRNMTSESLPRIGEAFGGRDHSTVLYACNKIESEKNNNESIKVALDTIKEKINI